MARAPGLEHEVAVDLRPDCVSLFRPLRQSRSDVQHSEGFGGGLYLGRQAPRPLAPAVEDLQLQGQRPVGGAGDAGVEIGELDGGEPHLVGQGLAVDEEAGERRPQQRLGLLGVGLDEVAEHAVVADLDGYAALHAEL